MPGAGAAADKNAALGAKLATENALEQQQKLAGGIEQKAKFYNKEGAKDTAKMGRITGMTLPEYIASSGKEFSDFYNTKGGELRQSIGSFQPNLLNSESSRLASQAYRQMLGEYESNLGNLAAGVTQRLQSVAEEAPERVFSRLSRNPAFNLQRDPEAMRLAGKPPIMQSNLEFTTKNLYTYNV